MNGQATTITDPEGKAEPKTFSFDYSYWSHDNFTDSDGLLVANNSKYASQQTVFDDLGQGVLNNAFEGYNTSLFAYGQTGSGKSFSMIGYGKNKGIVPITCDELFKKVEKGDPSVKYEVWYSMLEIYNEQVRDLLTKDNPKGGLQVKQNPKLGLFYVKDQKRVAVGSYEEINRRMEEGTKNRTVASTQMNATSSRAHTVIKITFNQITKVDGQERKKESEMNLVDLAGSERADSTGATGDRLKEGANINKSLSALGNVISALADLSMGKKKVMVPYRDSVLTKLLRNALGGNSKTIMIAALSPADINYDETLSTLRYADRAKKIKNQATVNENPMDKLIRELREENEKLKKLLGGELPMNTAGMSEAEKEKMRAEMKKDLQDQLQANAEAFNDLDFEAQRKRALSEDKILMQNSKKEPAGPYLTNVNEDPQLSHIVKLQIKKGETKLGRKDASPAPDIVLTGLGIQKNHAIISNNGEICIKPAVSGAKIRVNGQPLTGERALNHHDRIILGSNNMYVLINKEKSGDLSEGTPEGEISWDFLQKELAENSGFSANTAGLDKDQARLQEQILEVLPLVAEVNAVSEELDKYKMFEPTLMTSTGPEDQEPGTKLMIKVKDLRNDNTWLWERGKFMNRRYIIQEMYQQFIDQDEDWKKRSQNDDPFWDPAEPILIGTATVFLQSLSYALDFEDNDLTVTDHKGSEEASLSVKLIPCQSNGKPLGEDQFVEDSSELIGKPYNFKINLDSCKVHNSNYNKGLMLKGKYGKEIFETKMMKETLTPKFAYEKMIKIAKVTQDDVDNFDSGSVTLFLFANQVDSKAPKAREKLTTKQLKDMQGQGTGLPRGMRVGQRRNPSVAQAGNNQQISTLSRRLEYLERRDKHLQEVVTKWKKDIEANPSLDCKPFVNSVSTIVFSGNKFKTRVKMITTMTKGQTNQAIKASSEVQQKSSSGKNDGSKEGSKACVIM